MLIVLAILLLINVAPVLMLGGMVFGAIGNGSDLNSGDLFIPLVLLVATIASLIHAVLMSRRGRLGPAIGVAAIPAVLSGLAAAVVYYALSHMGGHH